MMVAGGHGDVHLKKRKVSMGIKEEGGRCDPNEVEKNASSEQCIAFTVSAAACFI